MPAARQTAESGGVLGPAEGHSRFAPDTFLPGRAPLPSRNDPQDGASAAVWMKEKAAADRARVPGLTPMLWCVRGGLYDLSPLVRIHPGGEVWIAATRGMDVTEWFETHHVDIARAEALLARFRVGACAGPWRPIFTFDDAGFYASLRRRVCELHKATPGGITGPARETKGAAAACVALWAAAFTAMARLPNTNGTRGSYALAIPSGVLMYTLFGLGHNFFHMRDSKWRHVFDLTCMASARWRLSHALAHHPFSNLEIDIEAAAVEPVGMSFMRSRPTNHPIVYLRWLFFMLAAGPITVLGSFAEVGKGRDPVKALWSDLLPLSQCAAAAALCGSTRRGIGLTAAMHAVASSILLTFSTPVHRSDHTWTEGCPGPVLDYGEHIVKTTHEFATDAGLAARVLIGFNDHVIHHLFPTVDLAKHQLIRPLLEEELRKHNVPMRQVSFPRLLYGTMRGLRRQPGDLFYVSPEARL